MDFTAEQLVMGNGTGEARGSQNGSPVPQINTTLIALDLTSSFSEGKARESHINYYADSTRANLPLPQVLNRDAANLCFGNCCVPVCSEE